MEENVFTDTHLSKDFNKVLQSCLFQCNMAGYQVESSPHYECLLSYQACINNLFINTFFLFSNITYQDKNLSIGLMNKMALVKQMVYTMKYNPENRTREYFDQVVELCNMIRMMIMYGLHKRNMLVRMSEKEPRGIETIEFWDKKTIFKKGDLVVKEVGKDKVWAI